MAVAAPDRMAVADQAEIDAEFLAIVVAEAPWALTEGELAPPRTGAPRPARVVRPGRSAVPDVPPPRVRDMRVGHRRPVAVARSPPDPRCSS